MSQTTTDPVIAAAGDIACDPSNSSFNGGNGTSNNCRQKHTSDLLVNQGLAAVLLLGDNQYYCGGYEAFLKSYDLSWGRVKSITYPAVGNHEYLTSGGTGCNSTNSGAAGHFKYFGAAAGDPKKGYYSFNIGTWHLVMLNSSCSSAGGCGETSPQGQWLRNDLAAHTNYCTLAFWHIPLFSSGGRASSTYKTFWDALYQYDADVVLNGHDHTYERFAPQTPSGTRDDARGIRQFVVGTGGANHTSFTTTARNSEVRNADTYGVLKLTLRPTSYDWQFVPEAGKTFRDSGSTSCHGASTPGPSPTPAPTPTPAPSATPSPSPTPAPTPTPRPSPTPTPTPSPTQTTDTVGPTAPFNLTATARSPTEVNLSWWRSLDLVGVTGYRVYRSTGTQAQTQVGITTSTSYSDTTVQPSTTYSYTVRGYDAAGNVSDPSNTATVSTPASAPTPTPSPRTLTFALAADTYVQADQASANFGSATSFTADSSPVTDGLLKFSVSGVGAGKVTSVKLRLRCVDSGGMGGSFHRVADTAWEEARVTYSTAPAHDATALASLGAVSSGSWYEVDLTPLVTRDGTYSVKIRSTSSDGSRYSSKEGTSGYAPQLVVTVQ